VWRPWIGIRRADDVAEKEEGRIIQFLFFEDGVERHVLTMMA
jgi:hypothetical protein